MPDLLSLRGMFKTVDVVQHSYLAWLASNDGTRQDNVRAYRDYYNGDHDTQLTARQREYLQVKTGQDFTANYCPIVVDALAERLKVIGFQTDDKAPEYWEWWQQNRMDAVQSVVHLAAVRDGDAFVLIAWDNATSQPVFTYEPAYDGTTGVKLHYDPDTGQMIFASKRWNIGQGPGAGKQRRMNLYFPDRIEKYASQSGEYEGAWQPFQPEGDASWPLPWLGMDGQPLGVPIAHFLNKDQGEHHGQSEIEDVIPLQNALNKSVIDLLAAADTTAFRILTMVGADPSGLSVVPGGWVYVNQPPSEAAIGFIPGEDLTPLIAMKDAMAMEIARVTRTPLSYFQISGERPAEGTLKQEETGLVMRARDRQVTFGNAWEDAMMMARKLSNLYGGTALSEDDDISALWEDAETRNETEFLQSLQLKQSLGVPQRELWSEMGYDEDKIAEFEAEQQRQQSLGGGLLRDFLRGGGGQ